MWRNSPIWLNRLDRYAVSIAMLYAVEPYTYKTSSPSRYVFTWNRSLNCIYVYIFGWLIHVHNVQDVFREWRTAPTRPQLGHRVHQTFTFHSNRTMENRSIKGGGSWLSIGTYKIYPQWKLCVWWNVSNQFVFGHRILLVCVLFWRMQLLCTFGYCPNWRYVYIWFKREAKRTWNYRRILRIYLNGLQIWFAGLQ